MREHVRVADSGQKSAKRIQEQRELLRLPDREPTTGEEDYFGDSKLPPRILLKRLEHCIANFAGRSSPCMSSVHTLERARRPLFDPRQTRSANQMSTAFSLIAEPSAKRRLRLNTARLCVNRIYFSRIQTHR